MSDALRQAAARLKRLYESNESYEMVYGVRPTGHGLKDKDVDAVLLWAVQQITAPQDVADVSNITVCWLPYQPHPFVHGARNGKDVWLTRDGSWTEDEGSELCNLQATQELREARGRADDGKPVDEAWLRSVGFERDTWHPFQYSGDTDIDVRCTPSMLVLGHRSDEWDVKQNPTRVDVRRLCEALGVPLNESNEE